MPIIALTGTMASGKGTVAEYLKKKGFEIYTYSDVVREEAKKLGYGQTRENLRKVGTLLKEKSGNMGILSRKLLAKIKTGKAVLDGVRNVAEINELRKRKGFFLIGVDAGQKIRFKRMQKRKRQGDPKTFEEFKEIDNKENNGENHGQEINRCLKAADFLIHNNSSVEELKKQIDKILYQITH